MALDGVFERFPRLRGASIEQGAEWLPGMLKKLDGAMQFAKTEPDLAALSLKASDYIRRQEQHHRTNTFQDEYKRFLERHGIEFDERYLWG